MIAKPLRAKLEEAADPKEQTKQPALRVVGQHQYQQTLSGEDQAIKDQQQMRPHGGSL